MKSLIAFLAFSSLAVHACEFDDTASINKIKESSKYTVVSTQNVPFPGYLFDKLDVGSFDYQRCKDAIREVTMKRPDGSLFSMVYTFEDYCDGGNSHGFVIDHKTFTPIAAIWDSDVSCF